MGWRDPLLGDFPLPSAPTSYITPPPSPHLSTALTVCVCMCIYLYISISIYKIFPSLSYLPASQTQVISSGDKAQAGLH